MMQRAFACGVILDALRLSVLAAMAGELAIEHVRGAG
jgi:hypothetical protein